MIYLYTILTVILIWFICMALALCYLRFVDSKEIREMKAFMAANKKPSCDKHLRTAVYFKDTNQTVIKCIKCDRVFETIEWRWHVEMNQATSDFILANRGDQLT